MGKPTYGNNMKHYILLVYITICLFYHILVFELHFMFYLQFLLYHFWQRLNKTRALTASLP